MRQDATDELEGFARAFLLGALRLADGGSSQALLAERLAQALAAGVDRQHPDAWPSIGHHDQVLVEATSIAVGLHWSRSQLWDGLPRRTQEQLIDWLAKCRGKWCADNNHVLFGATVQAFLASVGGQYDSGAIDGALDRLDEWYVGDGWYSDGVGRRFDHYNAWTFHLYPFFIEQMLQGKGGGMPGNDPTFEVFKARLRNFLEGYQHLFDAAGGTVLQGRSLIYRWGVLAPFWMGEIQEVSPLPPGRTRRLASGMLSDFAKAGTLDPGVLELGWKRSAPDLLQPYNTPGSPLWASKGFLGLLLPEHHTVWNNVEEPLALEQDNVLHPLHGPGWLVVARHKDGITRLLNHGSDGHPRSDDPLYRRLGYSSVTVPVRLNGIEDNSVRVGLRSTQSVHRGLIGGVAHRRGGASRFRLDAQGRDILVDVATFVVDDAEVRLARLRGVVEQTVRCTGWAVSSDEPVHVDLRPGWATATSAEGLVSSIGWVKAPGKSVAGVEANPFPHALGDHVGVPWLEIQKGTHSNLRCAWWVFLGRQWDAGLLPRVHLEWLDDGARLTVDGRAHHCPWIRENRWQGDNLNQGIFRVGNDNR